MKKKKLTSRKARNSVERELLKSGNDKSYTYEQRLERSDFVSRRVELTARKTDNSAAEIMFREYGDVLHRSRKQVAAAKTAMSKLKLEGVEDFEDFNAEDRITEEQGASLDERVSAEYARLTSEGYGSVQARNWISHHIYGSPE